MNAEQFVSIVKQVVELGAIDDVIKNITQLSGSKMDYRLKYLAEWYDSQNDEGRECIKQIVKETAITTLFGIFCVLDGVRAIENGPNKGKLELYFVKDNQRVLLNDFSDEGLHDIYRSME